MTELEKMWANLPYDGTDPDLRAYQTECRTRKEAFDTIPPNDLEAHMAGLADLVGSMNGVAMMKPFAIRTIIKKGKSAPMFGAPSGSPSSVIREPDMPVMVEKIPAIIIGYIANETTAESHRAK